MFDSIKNSPYGLQATLARAAMAAAERRVIEECEMRSAQALRIYGKFSVEIVDGEFAVYVAPARRNCGGYDWENKFRVHCARERVNGCPASHAIVEYVPL